MRVSTGRQQNPADHNGQASVRSGSGPATANVSTTSTNAPKFGQVTPVQPVPPVPSVSPGIDASPPRPPANPAPAGPGATTVPTCAAGDVELKTSTNGDRFPAGTTVKVATTARNISSRPCSVTNSCLYRRITVEDAAGTPVYNSSPSFLGHVCPLIYEVPRTLNPGETSTDAFTWDQHVCVTKEKCPGEQVLAGVYSAEGHWEQGAASSARFQIVPGPPSPPPSPTTTAPSVPPPSP